MARTSSHHIIVDKTIAAANESEQHFTERTACMSWRVRNNDAAAVLLIKTDDADDDANSSPVGTESFSEWFPPIPNVQNGYDLSNYRFRSAGTISFTVEYVVA